jgi:chromosome segregation ATPase
MPPTKVDMLYEKMLKGEDWSEIRSVGGSAAYTALEQYFDHVEDKYKKYQKILSEAQQWEEKLQAIKKAAAAEEENVVSLRSEKDKLTLEIAKQRETVDELSERKNKLEKGLQELKGRGVEDKTIQRFNSVNFGTNIELLQRISTAEEHTGLVEENRALKERNADLSKGNRELDEAIGKKTRACEELDSQIAEKQATIGAWSDSVKTVTEAVRKGYGNALLRALIDGLSSVEVKGDPQLSADRLLQTLLKAREAEEVERQLASSKARLEALNGELEQSRATLKAIKDDTLAEIQRAGGKAAKELETLRNNAESEYSKYVETQKQQIEATGNTLTDQYTSMVDERKTSLSKLSDDLSVKLNEYNETVAKWGRLKQKVGMYEELLSHGYIFLGILKNPNVIREVPIGTIATLMDRITDWIRLNMGNVTTQPTWDIKELDGNFNRFNDYSVLAMSIMVRDELEKRRG